MSNVPTEIRSAFADLPELSYWLADLHTPIGGEPAARLLGEHCEGVVPIYVDAHSRRISLAGYIRQTGPRKTEGGETT